MKIKLDTDNKVITIESPVNLKELYETLKKILPDDEWKEYDLKTNTTIEFPTQPIIIEKERWPSPYPTVPGQPWWYYAPYTSDDSTAGSHNTNKIEPLVSIDDIHAGIEEVNQQKTMGGVFYFDVR